MGSFRFLLIGGLSFAASCSPNKSGDTNEAAANGSKTYVSEYNWKLLQEVKLPDFSAGTKSSSQASGLRLNQTTASQDNPAPDTGVTSDAIDSRCLMDGSARSFANSFESSIRTTLTPPERKLCNGQEIRVGTTYKQVYGANGHILLKFIDRGDGSLYQVICDAQSKRRTFVNLYRFMEGERFKSAYWGGFGSNPARAGNYYSFSKFADNPQKLQVVSNWGNSQDYTEYTAEGEGMAEQYYEYDDRRGHDRIYFTREGGVSENLYYDFESPQDYDQRRTTFFDRNLFRTSRLEIPRGVRDAFGELPTIDISKPYHLAQADIPTLAPDINCFGPVEVIQCKDITANAADQGTEGRSADCRAPSRDNRDYIEPSEFKDEEGEADGYAFAEISARKWDRPVAVGEVIGLRAFIASPANGRVDLTAKAEIEIPSFLEKVEVNCDNVRTTGQLKYGIALTKEEQCEIKKDYPLLFKFKEVPGTDASIDLRVEDLTAKIRVNVSPALPYRFLLSFDSTPPNHTSCQIAGYVIEEKLSRSKSLLDPRQGQDISLKAKIFGCYTDGSIQDEFGKYSFQSSGMTIYPSNGSYVLSTGANDMELRLQPTSSRHFGYEFMDTFTFVK